MLHKYRIETAERLTGSKPTQDVECDGYVIMGFKRGEDGKFETISVAMQQISDADVVNGLYSNPDLRKCALMTGAIDRMEHNPIRRLMRWLRGEQDEQEA